MKHSADSYPGAESSVNEITDLAIAYYGAAVELIGKAEPEAPMSFAPARFYAIHAVEPFLNAWLRKSGLEASAIRKRSHNLADPSFVKALGLRKRTAAHLEALSEQREYLISRYAPDKVDTLTANNRMLATLREVMMKAGSHLRTPI